MVPIELDKPRHLYFGMRTFRELENAVGGRTLGQIVSDLESYGMNMLVQTLYHGLKHEDSSLNIGLVERIIEDKLRTDKTFRLGPVWDAIVDALKELGVFRSEKEANSGKQETPPVPA